jgi:hypothetical protein
VNELAGLRRGALILSLGLAPILMLISTALQPPFVESYVDRLADLDDAGAAAWASNVLFIATQIPMLVVFVGVAHLLRHHSPRLAVVCTVLGVLATFAEAVMGGTGLVFLTMASDPENIEPFASAWEQMESSPVMLLGLLGFGGTVLTLVLLSIGLFRSRLVPRWVPSLVWAFVVLEFFGSGLTSYASYAAALCLLVSFGAVVRHVQQTPRSDWAMGGAMAADPAVVV